MDIQNFNKKISKISALADNGNTDGHFSSLERDLLLSYIRELYDIALDGKPNINKMVAQVTVPEKVVEHIETKVIEPVEKMALEQPASVLVPAEIVIESTDIEKDIQIKPAAEIKVDVIHPSPIKNQNIDVLIEIFAEEKITDLSDKLASSPVKDLTKSMGINERIFTQQELFGNNQQVFNETLQKLNNCQNFDDAKQYLVENVIFSYDWTNENKVKKASTFIKFVKRKFS